MNTKTELSRTSGSVNFAASMQHPFGFAHRPRFAFENEGKGDVTGNEGGETPPDPTGIAASQAAAAKAAQEKADAEAAEAAKKTGPTDAEAKLLKELMTQKDTVKQTKTALEQAQAQLKAFEGIDPVAVRTLIEENAAKETKTLEDKGEWDRVKGIMIASHADAIKIKDERIAELEATIAQNGSELNKLTIGHKFAASTFIDKELTIGVSHAEKLYGAHFERKDGKIIGYDKPASASDKTPLVGADGEPLDFDDALKSLVEKDSEADRLKRAKILPGAGGGGDKHVDKTKKDDNGLKGKSAIAAALAARKGS